MPNSGSERQRGGRSNSRSNALGSRPAFCATSPKLDKLALRVRPLTDLARVSPNDKPHVTQRQHATCVPAHNAPAWQVPLTALAWLT